VTVVLEFSDCLTTKIQNIAPTRSFRERLCPPPQVKVGEGGGGTLLSLAQFCLSFDRRTSRPSFAFLLTSDHH
jgi:hypothetical protein